MRHVLIAATVAAALLLWACTVIPPRVDDDPPPPFEPSDDTATWRITNIDGQRIQIECLDNTITRTLENGTTLDVEIDPALIEWELGPVDLDAAPASRDA